MSGPGLHGPGSDVYVEATSPRNSSADQRPALVARPGTAEGVAAAVRAAGERGLRVVPQATGHGAGGILGDDVLLLDTSALTSVRLDPASRIVSAGAGSTWAMINAEAQHHGLLGLSGSAPSVGIAGYTFGGGVGWLCPEHGMASGALRSVDYVDGSGQLRHAADDAEDQVDREALFAFRGGGGVGIATSLTFDVFDVTDLHAGHLLWPIDALGSVAAAWADAIAGTELATSLAVLKVPPQAPPVPEHLRGTTVVHLALAAGDDPERARPLLDAVRAARPPEVDTWGPSDAERLGQIHLDPPAATPAIGDGRWLTEDAPARAVEILDLAADDDSPVVMLELRSVGRRRAARSGAATAVAGPYLVHAAAPITETADRPRIDVALQQLREHVTPVDAGLRLGSWAEGAVSVPGALPDPVRERAAAAADLVDPARLLRRSRLHA